MLPLIVGLKQLSGRSQGHIVVRHRGGGVKNKYRLIDFNRSISHYIPFQVVNLSYDPLRTSNIALILYANGILSYILANAAMRLYEVFGGNNFNQGSIQFLRAFRRGILVHSISCSNSNINAVFIRAAGTAGLMLGQYFSSYMLVKLPSKQHRLFFFDCTGIVGQNSNILERFTNKRKGGTNRLLNIRPSVRGVAMNPVDHPHGGGEGKSSGGRHPVSP